MSTDHTHRTAVCTNWTAHYGSSDEIARAVRRTTGFWSVVFIDLYSPTLELEMQGETRWDGLHPNDYGYRTMF